MSSLIFFAIIYGIYSLYTFLNEGAIDWKRCTTQDKRMRNLSKCIKEGKPYEETPYEKKMHERFGYKYDEWYKRYLDTGEFNSGEASVWNLEHLMFK